MCQVFFFGRMQQIFRKSVIVHRSLKYERFNRKRYFMAALVQSQKEEDEVDAKRENKT